MQSRPNDLLDNWTFLEADFFREYGIDLNREVHTMSWRRFRCLLVGLSADAVYRAVTGESGQAKRPVSGPAASALLKSWNQ